MKIRHCSIFWGENYPHFKPVTVSVTVQSTLQAGQCIRHRCRTCVPEALKFNFTIFLPLLGCHSEEAVIIGDRMDTDIIAGTESGIDTVLVLSGVSSKETPELYAYQPTMILNGVGDIVTMAEAAAVSEK